MRQDIIDLYNDASSFSIYTLGLNGKERQAVSDNLRESTESGLIMRLGLVGDNTFTMRILVDEPLSETEETEWVGKIEWMLDVADGKLAIEGGFASVNFEPEGIQDMIDDDVLRVVDVLQGKYRVTVYTMITNINGTECLGVVDDEAIGTYFRRTRPDTVFPDWLKYHMVDWSDEDPGYEDEWADFDEGEYRDISKKLSTGDYPYIDIIIHLSRLTEEEGSPQLVDDMFYDHGLFKEAVNPRKPDLCPLGLLIDPEIVVQYEKENRQTDIAPTDGQERINIDIPTNALISAWVNHNSSGVQSELERRGEIVVDPLIEIFETSDKTALRNRVAGLLAEIGGERALDTLIKAVDYDDPDLGHTVLGMLGKFRGNRVYEILLSALTHNNSLTRVKALQAFGEFDDPRVISHLLEALSSDHHDMVQVARNTISARILTQRASTGEMLFTDALFKAIETNDSKQLQLNLIDNVLGFLPMTAWESVQGIFAKLSDSDDAEIRFKAIMMRGTIENDREFETVVTATSSDNPETRATAFRLLGHWTKSDSVELLMKGLDDPDPSVQYYAVAGLVGLGDARAVKRLIKALSNVHQSVHNTAAMALDNIGTDEALAALEAWRKKK